MIIDTPATDAWYFRLQGCPVPAVGALTDREVSVDLPGIARAAVARLAAQGCRRLGLIAWHGQSAFAEAVRNHGLSTCDAWVRVGLDPAVRGAGWDDFREIWSAPEKPDGLLILDDMLFADAQLAMFELGVRVPEQVRLAMAASRNASPAIRLPLTLFETDPAELAAGLVCLLQQRLAGERTGPVRRFVSFREVSMEPQGVTESGSSKTPGKPAEVAGTRPAT